MTLHLRENMKKGVFVDRLTEISVSSALEAYEVSQQAICPKQTLFTVYFHKQFINRA